MISNVSHTFAFLELREQLLEQNLLRGEQNRRRFTGPPQNSQHPNAWGSPIFPNFTGFSSSSCALVLSILSSKEASGAETEAEVSQFSAEVVTVSPGSSHVASVITGSASSVGSVVSRCKSWKIQNSKHHCTIQCSLSKINRIHKNLKSYMQSNSWTPLDAS